MDARQKHSSEAEHFFFFFLNSKTVIVHQAGDVRTKSGNHMRRLAVRCCVSGWGAQFAVEMIIELIAVIMAIRAPTG